MTPVFAISQRRPIFFSGPWVMILDMLVVLTLILMVPGCGQPNGASSDQRQTEQDGSDPNPRGSTPKPPLEIRPTVLMPGEFEREAERNRAKPGHWMAANLPIVANHKDHHLEFLAHAVTTANYLPVPLPGTPFFIITSRSLALPKGEKKLVETLVFLPKRKEPSSAVTLQLELKYRSGLTALSETQPIQVLQPYQYHLVVLSKTPANYRFLRLIDAVALPVLGAFVAPPFYHIVLPTADHPLPVPRHVLAWTTIAYVIWDDFSPEDLDSAQQKALLDWLHFGGQLVINGPTSYHQLRGSFLDPYLPADSLGSRNLSGADFDELNSFWSIPKANEPTRQRLFSIPESAPMLGLELAHRPMGSFLTGTGALVCERPVGRGRIVLTAFDLQDRRVRNWQSFSGFFHGAMLRRPARKFAESSFGEYSFCWKKSQSSIIFDPLLATTLRFVSRDLSHVDATSLPAWYRMAIDQLSGPWGQQLTVSADDELIIRFMVPGIASRDRDDPRYFGGFESDDQAGTGGWNDDKGIAVAAREALSKTTGITPPTRGFVFRMLLGYLAVLAVVNWGFFKLIGRVEWAWALMPILAIAGAFVVVRAAQLDIGFVRSETTVGLLELHGGYPRGHLTQFSGLYSSLSTRFAVDFDNTGGLAAPFARKTEAVLTGTSYNPVTLRCGSAHQFRNILVQSNTTSMIHSEEFIDVAGPISVVKEQDRWVVHNESHLTLKAAGVVWRAQPDQYQLAWLGPFSPGESRPLDFMEVEQHHLYQSWRNEASLLSTTMFCRKVWLDLAGRSNSPKHSLSEDPWDNGDDSVEQWLNSYYFPLSVLTSHPDIIDWGDRFAQLYYQTHQPRENGNADDPMVSWPQFCDVMGRMGKPPGQESVNLGPLLDVLAETLELAPGEMRLLARCDERLGTRQIAPQPTQSRQGTLVLVRLLGGDLPPVERDANTLYDFADQTDLDRLLDDKRFDDRQRLDSLEDEEGDDE